MTREEEKNIVLRIIQGDQSLYDNIVRLYSPKILSVIKGVVGNNEDSEEVAQDVFVKAYFSLDKFRGECSLSTWFFRIAYNMAISKIRKKKREFMPLEVINDKLKDDSGIPGEENEKENLFKILDSILNELEPQDKFLILLFYNQEKSIKEISQITSLSESNIKIKLHRIKKRLRDSAGDKIELCYG